MFLLCLHFTDLLCVLKVIKNTLKNHYRYAFDVLADM